MNHNFQFGRRGMVTTVLSMCANRPSPTTTLKPPIYLTALSETSPDTKLASDINHLYLPNYNLASGQNAVDKTSPRAEPHLT